jgi:hypothetical protein
MRTCTSIAFGLWIGLAAGVLTSHSARAQDVDGNIFTSPTVDFYINRTRNQDRANVGLQATINRELNVSGGGGGVGTSYQPSFLQGSGFGGGGGAVVEKPFAHASHRPTVSPYLNLLREDLTDDVIPNYQTLVRPQLEQIAFQQSQQRQNDMVYRQLQQIQARAGFNPQGSQVMLPTGHVTTYQFLGSYYPSLQRRR